MTVRIGVFGALAFSFGLSLGFFIGRTPLTVRGSGIQEACREMAGEVSSKCHEADRWRDRIEKKYPKPENNEQALKSQEWERSMSWSQACDDAKEQLIEAVLAALEPTPKSSTK